MVPVSSRGVSWALGALVALAYATVLVGGQTFADAGWLTAVAPARLAAADAVAAGQVPGWWHEAGFGVPLLAEPGHGAAYPPIWLAAGPAALDAIAIAHLWLLALGTAALAGRLGADPAGRLLAGAAVALSATAAGALITGHLFALAWSPLAAERAFALAEARDRRSRIRRALAVAGCVAAAALGGAPAIVAGTIATVIAVGLARGRGPGGAWTAAAAAAGVAVAAIQLAPALLHELAGHAAGAPRSRPAIRLVELLAPGTTAVHGATLGGGAAVLALAVLARSRWLVVPLALAAAAAAGALPLALAWVWLGALAGAGLSALTREPPWRATRRWALAVAGVLVVAAIAVALARNPIAAAVDRAGLDGPALVEPALVHAGVAAAFAVVAIALTIAAAYRRQPALAALAALVALVEVALAGRAAVPRIARPDRPGLVAPLAAEVPTRVLRHPRPTRLTDDLARAAGASAARHGVAAVPGRDPARLAAEDRLVTATAASAARLLDRYAIDRAIVPASIVTAAGLRELARHGDHALVASDARRPPAFWVSRWRHVPDDVAVAALVPPPGRPAEPAGTVLLAGAGPPGGGDELAAPRPCRLERAGVNRVVLGCEVTAPGRAVLLDAWAPGWSATVDGRPARVERADLITRAVPVAAGDRTIVLSYRPPGLALGAAITLLALINAALLAWLTRRGGRWT